MVGLTVFVLEKVLSGPGETGRYGCGWNLGARPAERAVDAGGVGGRESGLRGPALLVPRLRALEFPQWKHSVCAAPGESQDVVAGATATKGMDFKFELVLITYN